jgi:hypothetical protein
MENLASIALDDGETIQDSEREGRHCEEVHGRDDLAVIAPESSPEFSVPAREETSAGCSEKLYVQRRRSRV